jgi:hypothetical protein
LREKGQGLERLDRLVRSMRPASDDRGHLGGTRHRPCDRGDQPRPWPRWWSSPALDAIEVTAAKAMLASGTMTAAEVARGRVQRQNAWAVTAQ